MITTLGKGLIRAYIAGLAPSIGQSISVGIRNNVATLADTQLGFEVARVPVTSVSLDPVTNKVIFKGTMESANALKVYEIGLWSSLGEDDSMLVLGFDEFDEGWSGDVSAWQEAPTVSRIGTSVMSIAIAANTVPKVITYPVDAMDLSPFLGSDDSWTIAFSKSGAANVTIKLKMTSALGTSEINFFPSNTTATGYLFGTALIKDSVTTGEFDPSAVEQFDLSVIPAAGNATASTIQLDGVQASNAPSERAGSVLVARAVVSPVFSSPSSSSTDLEYELEVIV